MDAANASSRPQANSVPATGDSGNSAAADSKPTGRTGAGLSLLDMCHIVSHWYPMDFGCAVVGLCCETYADEALLRTVARAPGGPSLLRAAVRCPSMSLGRVQLLAHLEDPVKLNRRVKGYTILHEAVLSMRHDLLAVLLALPGLDLAIRCHGQKVVDMRGEGAEADGHYSRVQAGYEPAEPEPSAGATGEAQGEPGRRWLWVPGHTAFTLACSPALDTLGVFDTPDTYFKGKDRGKGRGHGLPHHPDLTKCAEVLAADPRCSPATIGGLENRTHLAWACAAGLTGVVRAWLADPRCTPDHVIQTLDQPTEPWRLRDGNEYRNTTVFGVACSAVQARHSWAERGQGHPWGDETSPAECARLLARHPSCSPSDRDDHVHDDEVAQCGLSNMVWACNAGLADVVETWLADPRCTVSSIVQRPGHDEWCGWGALAEAIDMPRLPGKVDCARLIAVSHLTRLSYAVNPVLYQSDLSAACKAGLVDVVTALLAHPVLLPEHMLKAAEAWAFGQAVATIMMMMERRTDGHSPTGARSSDVLSCALLLADRDGFDFTTNQKLDWCNPSPFHFAAKAGLLPLVQKWLADPRCSHALLTAQEDSPYGHPQAEAIHPKTGHTPFSACCALSKHGLTAERLAVARAIAASPQCSPADTCADGWNQLTWAVRAGLWDVVRTWLRDARCTAEVWWATVAAWSWMALMLLLEVPETVVKVPWLLLRWLGLIPAGFSWQFTYLLIFLMGDGSSVNRVLIGIAAWLLASLLTR